MKQLIEDARKVLLDEAKVTKINGVPVLDPKKKHKKIGIGGQHDFSMFDGLEIHSYNPKKDPPMIVSGTSEAIVKFMTSKLRAQADDVWYDLGDAIVDPDWAEKEGL